MTNSKNQINTNESDVSENNLRERYPEALEALLRDHTTQKNIFWATDNYIDMGEEFAYKSPITPSLITGKYSKVIRPRIQKDKELQTARVRDMAEVFTPSWICNAQNNLIDHSWFGRENIFNTEITDSNGIHSWIPTQERIIFPDGKNWKDYVGLNRLEITCGEAPYITSRYDTTTGVFIPVENRIGLLDRKLRVVNENTVSSSEWLEAVQTAYRSIYAYEWQGDSLLLAREAMLNTFIENYKLKFGRLPQAKSIKFMAYIISWNVWQMDGIKIVVPESCHDVEVNDLFDDKRTEPCRGCVSGDNSKHTGIYCLIKDWKSKDPKTNQIGKKIQFRSLMMGDIK